MCEVLLTERQGTDLVETEGEDVGLVRVGQMSDELDLVGLDDRVARPEEDGGQERAERHERAARAALLCTPAGHRLAHDYDHVVVRHAGVHGGVHGVGVAGMAAGGG